MSYAVEVENVRKIFKVHLEKSNYLKDAVILRNRNRVDRREILKGINFRIKKGEAVGIIGKNGCGKSTLLKLLTRILSPDEGEIKIKGRVSSLIELGAGFHPDMSGRENIYINASIFGITRKETAQRIDDIIRFSELEDYIDTPVRTYSSGMYMRLAFAVAINVDADILLIDEILAVGDAAFQDKCFEHLKQLKACGVTIVIVSHSLNQIEEICDRAIWIDNGVVREDGHPSDICSHYIDFMEKARIMRAHAEYEERRLKNPTANNSELAQQARNISCYDICAQCCPDVVRLGNGKLRFTCIQLTDAEGRPVVRFGTKQTICLKLTLSRDLQNGERLNLEIFKEGNILCWGSHFDHVNSIMEIRYENQLLTEGKYWFDMRLYAIDNIKQDEIFHIVEFTISAGQEKQTDNYGIVNLDYKIETFH